MSSGICAWVWVIETLALVLNAKRSRPGFSRVMVSRSSLAARNSLMSPVREAPHQKAIAASNSDSAQTVRKAFTEGVIHATSSAPSNRVIGSTASTCAAPA